VIGSLAVVGLSILISVSFIGFAGWKFDLMFSMLPTVLIAVGVADAVHIITEFRTNHKSLNDRREAIKRTIYLTGLPCMFTSLTTVAGFTSMAISPIKSIKHFSMYSAVGVVGAFVLSITFLIIFLSFGSRQCRSSSSENPVKKDLGKKLLKKMLQLIATFDIKNRWTIIIVSFLILLFAAAGIFQMKVDSNYLSDFSDQVDIKRVTMRVDEVMIGCLAISIAVDDTIHLVARYQHEFRRSGNYRDALMCSMTHVGRALFITSIVLISGFLIFLNSLMDSLAQFGVLIAATISVALLADFFLMPALIIVFKPFGPEFSTKEEGTTAYTPCAHL